MAAGKLFRGANLYLALAGLLSGAMLFAPIAFASNFASGLHATVYGSWLVLEQSLGHGVTTASSRTILQLPLQMPYAALAVIGCLLSWILVFVNANGERKHVWIGRAMMLALVHLFWGALVRYLATTYVGTASLAADIEGGFQREFLLHFFILYFLWRAWRKQADALKE